MSRGAPREDAGLGIDITGANAVVSIEVMLAEERCRDLWGAAAFLMPAATGSDSPRNLPLDATPFPHVNCVLYPAQSFPSSRHCEQYGRLRSHCAPVLAHVKQSLAAPAGGALFLLLRGAGLSAATEWFDLAAAIDAILRVPRKACL